MSLNITVDVNGEVVSRVSVMNQGPTCPEEAAPGGERLYWWRVLDGDRAGLAGELRHRRSDGADRLVRAVFERLAPVESDPPSPARLHSALVDIADAGEMVRVSTSTSWCAMYDEMLDRWIEMGGVPADLSTIEAALRILFSLRRQFDEVGLALDELVAELDRSAP